MSDLDCPYCGEGNEVCHDDGFGYEEDKRHEMECKHCDKTFVFTTCISFDFDPAKADCLNGGAHRLKESRTFPKRYTKMRCEDCDYSEPLPEGHPFLLETESSAEAE